MDLVIGAVEDYFVAPSAAFLSECARNSTTGLLVDDCSAFDGYPDREALTRQFLVATIVFTLGGLFFYGLFSGVNYMFLYDQNGNLDHRPEPGQVWREIEMSLKAIPQMAVLTAPFIVAECRGYSKLYGPGTAHGYLDYGHGYNLLSVALFIAFTDMAIYWIHRGLHSKFFYKWLHKDHHIWKSPTPMASHAFHPIDGWVQSVPYHVFVFVVPMHKVVFLSLFVFVNLWTVAIHDGISFEPPSWVNGAAHHTYHHKDFNYNYGQYFTFWDWVGGSLRDPYAEERLLHPDVMKRNADKKRQSDLNLRVLGAQVVAKKLQ